MSVYSRNLSGLNQKVIVGTNASYTSSTTFNAFITASAEGEVGVFLASGALKSTALAAGDQFFIAQKRDGFVNKTPILNFNDIFRKLRTAYIAPVTEVVTVGYVGSGTNNLSYDFSLASNTNTLTFGITARDFTPGNQPFPVQEGYATVNSTTADQYAVTSAIVSQLNGELDYERVYPDKFCYAEILTDGATAAPTGTVTTFSVVNGSNYVSPNGTVTSIAVGTYVTFTGAMYKVKQIGLGAGNDFLLDRVFQGATNAALALASVKTITFTSGTTRLGVRLTGTSTDFSFNALPFGPSGNNFLSSVVTVSTPWVLGAGSGNSIFQLESVEGVEFDGVGSTRNAPFREDYGTPSLFSVKTNTYDQIFLDLAPSIKPSAALPHYSQIQIERILIATVVGSGLGSSLQTVFGV